MSYIAWAILALVAYSLVPPSIKLATEEYPIMVVSLLANVILTVVNLIVVVYLFDGGLPSLTAPKIVYVIGAGLFLSVGVLAYFYSLSIGPVSVVTPIFGMFLVGSTVIGMALLGEAVTARKLAGLVFAAIAVYLTSAT